MAIISTDINRVITKNASGAGEVEMQGSISYNTDNGVATVTITSVSITEAFSGDTTGWPFDCYAVLSTGLTDGVGEDPYNYEGDRHNYNTPTAPSPVASSIQAVTVDYVNPLSQSQGTNLLSSNIVFSTTVSITPPTSTIYLFLNIYRRRNVSGSQLDVWSGWIASASLSWNLYNIEYYANGGTGAPSPQTKIQQTPINLSSTEPTRTGYTFQGWATSNSATTAEYQPEEIYTDDENLYLYAVWTRITYPVTYYANGGTNAPGSQIKIHGTSLTLSSQIPSRTNYGFRGWAISASSTSIAYTPGEIYTENADLNLYAIWTFSIRDRKTTIEGNEVWALATGLTDSWNVNPTPVTSINLPSSNPEDPLSSDSYYYLTWELLIWSLYVGRQMTMPSFNQETSYDIGSISNNVWVSYTDELGVRHPLNSTLTVSLRSRPNWSIPQRFRSYELRFTISGDASSDMPPEETKLWITYKGIHEQAIFQFSDVGWCDNTLTLDSLPAIDDIPSSLQDICSYWGNSEHGGYVTGADESMMIGSPGVRLSLDLRETGLVKIRCLVPDSFTADLESYNPLGGFGSATGVSLNRETGIFSSTTTQGYLVDVNFPY